MRELSSRFHFDLIKLDIFKKYLELSSVCETQKISINFLNVNENSNEYFGSQ